MKNNIIEEIINIEWDMFQDVKNIGGRAKCQDNYTTFKIMRFSQFKAWDENICQSYLEDLKKAIKEKRNLLTEKYARMMKYTHKEEYDKLERQLPIITDEVLNLVEEILKLNQEQEEMYANKYPKLRSLGRQNKNTKSATIDIYLEGELLTYSKSTLKLLHKYLLELKEKNESIAIRISENTVKIYGYDSIDIAEKEL